jgi:hypothetical protein
MATRVEELMQQINQLEEQVPAIEKSEKESKKN